MGNMMEMADREYAENVADPDVDECKCRGRGWISTPFDSWRKCPFHYKGQEHPEYEG